MTATHPDGSAGRRRVRLPGMARLRPSTLRGKLTWGLVVLLAISCATVGLALVLAVRGYLTGQLDQQLASAQGRFPATLEMITKGDQYDPGHTDGHDPDADTRGQSVGTFGARMSSGKVAAAAVVRLAGQEVVTLTRTDQADLSEVAADGHAHSVHLSALGDYRLYATTGKDSDLLITGLPLAPVQDTVDQLALVASTVFGGALVLTGVAGALWVRHSLRPLREVVATAAAVTTLRLDSGQVTLPAPAAPDNPRSETGQVTAALSQMLGHVQDALAKRHTSEERLRSFAADASHELRTPVASIRGHAELALRRQDAGSDRTRRSLQRIAAESTRMSGIVDDLLLLARLDAGRPLDRGTVDLSRLVLDCAEDARAAGPDHEWTLDLPESPIEITGDSHRLAQAIANLLANARLHTPAGTNVAICLEQRPDSPCVLTVADDGPGIPYEFQHTLFERFTRADRRHPGREPGSTGAGLGLSISAAIAAAHHGSLTLASTPGSTVFTLFLPHHVGSAP